MHPSIKRAATIVLNIAINTNDTLSFENAFSNCDETKFALFYDRYSAAVFGIIGRIITNQELAESVLSKAFITAWNHKQTFDYTKSTLFTWFVRLVRKIAFSEINLLTDKTKQPIINVYSHNSIYEKNNVANSSQSGNVLLAEPPSKTSIVFKMIYYKGLSYEQVSKELNITLSELHIIIREAIKNSKEL